ncbi:serine protease inhibitor [Algoriphagus iocasae]|uniref:Serine protease inhibitor n=1 Tax=Algoriphagus iocasae TaxID=1836499 RepID=A0A841MRU4_9BACT|nr:serine protease inhibitor [Algoriphagus iocasae]
MRKIATITKVLLLSLIFICSGTMEYELVNSIFIQNESVHEVEIINSREVFHYHSRKNKERENPCFSFKKPYIQEISRISKTEFPEVFISKTPIFIRNSCFLI